MNLIRSERLGPVRAFVVALMAYVVAATGLMGAVGHSSAVASPNGLMVLCTLEGMTTVREDGSVPVQKPQATEHCLVCTGVTAPSVTTDVIAIVAIAPPVAAPAVPRSYEAILATHAPAGLDATREPRAPPFAI